VKSSESDIVDVAVIGAGPVGLAAAIEARRAGLSARIIEKGALVNSLVGYPTQMEFFSTPDLLEIGDHPFPCLGYKPTREEAIEYYRKVAERERLDARLYERVERLDGEADEFVVVTDRGEHRARRVVVATGFFDVPNMLGAPGQDLPKVSHYFKEPYPYSGQKVVVVGAKNSAAKAALLCHRHGAEVTMLVRGEAISPSVKYWIKPDLENRIAEGSIRALFKATLVSIDEKTVTYVDADGEHTIENDWVLALTGYRPNYPLLEALGVSWADDDARTPLLDPDTFESGREGVYLAGTVCGGLATSRWFIENGRFHAQVIASEIARRLRMAAYPAKIE
jgi:thioredoxin reductase (NADPH)